MCAAKTRINRTPFARSFFFNMKNPFSLFCDDTGAVSMMRVVMFMVVLAVIGSKFYNAHLTGQPIVWTMADLGIIGTLVGGKCIQNSQEAKTTIPSTP